MRAGGDPHPRVGQHVDGSQRVGDGRHEALEQAVAGAHVVVGSGNRLQQGGRPQPTREAREHVPSHRGRPQPTQDVRDHVPASRSQPTRDVREHIPSHGGRSSPTRDVREHVPVGRTLRSAQRGEEGIEDSATAPQAGGDGLEGAEQDRRRETVLALKRGTGVDDRARPLTRSYAHTHVWTHARTHAGTCRGRAGE